MKFLYFNCLAHPPRPKGNALNTINEYLMYLNIAETQQKSTTNPQLKEQATSFERVQQVRSTLGRSNSKMAITVNYILHKCDFHQGNFFESETTMAKKLCVSRRTVQRAVAFVRSLFMVRRKRRFNRSNVYALAQWIRQESIIDQLADILPGLRNLLCLTILIPTAMWYHPRANAGRQEFGALYYIRSYEDLKIDSNRINNHTTKRIYDQEQDKTLQRGYCKPKTMQSYAVVDKNPLSSHTTEAIEYQKPVLQKEKTNNMAMYRLVDLVYGSVTDIGVRSGHLQEEDTKKLHNYDNRKAVSEFKEFMKDRYERLQETVNALPLTDEKKKEIIQQQLKQYTDRLPINDRMRLEAEGFTL